MRWSDGVAQRIFLVPSNYSADSVRLSASTPAALGVHITDQHTKSPLSNSEKGLSCSYRRATSGRP
ncbi:MAG: hypothetical protein ABI068_02875, partial [Ktedonobacterales bacterium]